MKINILTLVAVLAVMLAKAQDKKEKANHLKFGIKAGFTSSNYKGNFSGHDPNNGFYVGGLVDFSVSERFHIQPELLYSVEGAKGLKVDYLRVPIMAKCYIMDRLNLFAGPEIAFKAGGDAAIKDSLNSIDYGLGFGAGYELYNGLIFDIRSNLGLINIYKDNSDNAKNVSINIGLGYRF